MLSGTAGFSCCKQCGAGIIELNRNRGSSGRRRRGADAVRLQALNHNCASKNPGPVGMLGVRGTLLLLLFRVGAPEHPGREIRLVSAAPRNGQGKWGGVCMGISIGFGQTSVNLFAL